MGYAHEAHKINALMIMRNFYRDYLTLPATRCLRYLATESTYSKRLSFFHWLRIRDSNPWPSGYEPDELPLLPIRYNVRLVWACHQEAAEICYLGFAESATTDFPLWNFTSLHFRSLFTNRCLYGLGSPQKHTLFMNVRVSSLDACHISQLSRYLRWLIRPLWRVQNVCI